MHAVVRAPCSNFEDGAHSEQVLWQTWLTSHCGNHRFRSCGTTVISIYACSYFYPPLDVLVRRSTHYLAGGTGLVRYLITDRSPETDKL